MYENKKKRKLLILIIIIILLICFTIFLFNIILKPQNNSYPKKHLKEEETRILPTATCSFDINSLTNKDVTVKLIDANTEIIITNNDGKDTYTFTENGEFTFQYVNKYGDMGSTTAKVDWIDKTAPLALISFSPSKNNPNFVVATLNSISEEIIILNNDGKNYYEFTENGQFQFTYQDLAGNINSTTAQVNWLTSSSKPSSNNSNYYPENNILKEEEEEKQEEETKKPTPKIDKEEINNDLSSKDSSKTSKNLHLYLKIFLIIDIFLLIIFLIIIGFKKRKK